MPTKKKNSTETTSGLSTAATASAAKKPSHAAATHKSTARKSTVKPRTKIVTAAPAPVAFVPAAHHEEIARTAYFLWLNRGAGAGNETEDWQQAVEIVAARYRG